MNIGRLSKSGQTRKIFKRVSAALVFKGLGALAGFGLAIWIARYLGPEATGNYYTGLRLALFCAFM